jgi:radical SAM protein with 4Fe4S-binding SPASM domain
MKRVLLQEGVAASCYFRSSVVPPNRKALLQITERCNLFCAHCFISARNHGDTMDLAVIDDRLIPRLEQCRVISVTLTGGEPFTHPDVLEITQALLGAGIEVTICTNATLISAKQIERLSRMNGVHVNVSLDGFRPESHGKFRGKRNSFFKTIETIILLGQYGLLKGILVTPNNLANIEEYAELCDFAAKNNAAYILMNPLSNFGRGIKSMKRLSPSRQEMNKIREITSQYSDRVELVYIRFPNDSLPLSSCEAGNIIYVFVHGELTVCPYIVFAAKTPNSKHRPEEFFVGNILHDTDIAQQLDNYKFNTHCSLGNNYLCKSCQMAAKCGKGCPAAIIASGWRIEEGIDIDLCPNCRDNRVHL